jgi:hypothetical protein
VAHIEIAGNSSAQQRREAVVVRLFGAGIAVYVKELQHGGVCALSSSRARHMHQSLTLKLMNCNRTHGKARKRERER